MLYQVKQPFIFTLFGASGDLARLKLFPAIYQLALQKRLPKEYYIVGFARTPMERVQFQKQFEDSVRTKEGSNLNEKILADMHEHLYYFSGQYTSRADFDAYRAWLAQTTGGKSLMHLAYFSVPPVVFKDIILHLAETRANPDEDIRLIIEKPFGGSQATAEELFHFVAQHFREDQVYLLDHYLGKTSVQSIMHLRHSNRLLNLMMKGREVANIQITAFESIGIADRVGYFENTGIIKDMIQSHLLQTLALVTMSIPITERAESIHRERHNILSAILPPQDKGDVILGQYRGYKKEKGVPATSKTETFVGMRLFIDRESWHNVPIYLRTGKKTHEKHTFVVIELKKFDFQSPQEEPNRLVFELQPDERIGIKLVNKLGEKAEYQEVSAMASVACDIEGCLNDHAALILDAIKGDKTNFLSFPEIIATWRVTDGILDVIEKHHVKVENYDDGSHGPDSQHQLTKIDNFTWYDVDM